MEFAAALGAFDACLCRRLSISTAGDGLLDGLLDRDERSYWQPMISGYAMFASS